MFACMGQTNNSQEIFLFNEMKEGSECAFDFFFNFYYPGLCVFAQKKINISEEDAKNIVQDVFLKFWNDRHKLNIQTSVRSYLFTSVRNKCLDFARRLDNKIEFDEISYDLKMADDFFETFVFSELQALFTKSLEKLPDRCRDVFKLKRFEMLKNKEVASKLNISEKTVENQMTKALKILKKELKDYLPLVIIFEFFALIKQLFQTILLLSSTST